MQYLEYAIKWYIFFYSIRRFVHSFHNTDKKKTWKRVVRFWLSYTTPTAESNLNWKHLCFELFITDVCIDYFYHYLMIIFICWFLIIIKRLLNFHKRLFFSPQEAIMTAQFRYCKETIARPMWRNRSVFCIEYALIS